MRGFRSAKEGLRDPRTAYTFLVVVSIALFIMGGVSRRLTKNLDAERLASERRALTLCADSLDGYLTAEDDNGRLAGALRFGDAAASLDCADRVKTALTALSHELDEADAENLRRLSALFRRLAATEYADADAAREGVSGSLLGSGYGLDDHIKSEPADNPPYTPPTDDVSKRRENLAAKRAEELASALFGSPARLMRFNRTGEGFVISGGNYRAVFSTWDGHLTSFFCARAGSSGGHPSPDIRILMGYDISRGILRQVTGQTGGYTAVRVMVGGRTARAVYDAAGRLCAFREESDEK